MSIHVQLEQFEGPMGLLLYLIKKEEMDISNIQIHKITSQYLDYIKVMRNFDLEVAGDFVAMAATLIHIKSRMLLPHYNEAGEVVETEDPRKDLINRLLEYQKYQEASKKLNELKLLGRDVFCRGQKEAYEAGVEEIVLEENALYQMISLYRVALLKMKRRVHKVYAKGQSIASRIMEIKDRIVYGKQTDLRSLLTEGEHTRTKLLITFLSLLELTRLGFISIFQSDVYGEIYINATREIERDVVARVQEYETPDADAVANSWVDRAAPELAPVAEPTWEDEVVDQLGDLSEDEFESLLSDPSQALLQNLGSDPKPDLDLNLSQMSQELESQLDARTAEVAAEEAASLTEYMADYIADFVTELQPAPVAEVALATAEFVVAEEERKTPPEANASLEKTESLDPSDFDVR